MRSAGAGALGCGACLLAGLSGATQAAGALLGSAAALEGELSHGVERVVVASRDGDFIEVEVEVRGAPLDVRLLGAEGEPVRRFLDGARGSHRFRWVSEGGEQRLELESPGATRYRLTLLRQVAEAGQVAPPRSYMSPAIAEVAKALSTGGDTGEFWREVAHRGTPLVEAAGAGESIVTFLYRGAERNVRVLGAPASDHVYLERLGQSDIWFRSFRLPDDAFLSYQLAPDVPELPGTFWQRRIAILATAQADPLNRVPWPDAGADRFNRWSTLRLPEAPAPGWLASAPDVPKGEVASHVFASDILGNEREIALYKPAAFDPAREGNLLLFLFDGDQYRSRVSAPTILDNLIASGQLPPVVAVLVGNADREARGRELPDSSAFARAMAEELLPWVAGRTGMAPRAERTLLAGSSYGGLGATTIALRHPASFGNVVALSGSFWWHPAGQREEAPVYVADWLAGQPRVPVRFFLSAGLYEAGRGGDLPGILGTSRHVRDVLRAKGYQVSYRQYAGGHDYFVWQVALGEGLLDLFGRL